MFGIYPGGAGDLEALPAGVHEAAAYLELRVSESALRPALPTAGQRPLHAADDPLHVRRRLRTGARSKSR